MQETAATRDLNWLLDELAGGVKEVEHGIVLSADGLLRASSAGLGPAKREHLAAVAAGMQSLAKAAGALVGGGDPRQLVVEWTSGFLVVTAAGEGACLAVWCTREADIGLVAYEMAMLVARVGTYFIALPRTDSPVAAKAVTQGGPGRGPVVRR